MAEEADGIGMVLYNPPHAQRRLLPQEFATICQAVPSLIGIKVAGGDNVWFAQMQRSVPDIAIFVPGHLLADMLPQGAQGSYSNVACLHPLFAQRWYRQMRADIGDAQELGRRIQSFMSCHIIPLIEQGYSNQAVDKLLGCVGGWTELTPRVRWPYQSVAAAEVVRLRHIACALLPEFVHSSESQFDDSSGDEFRLTQQSQIEPSHFTATKENRESNGPL